MDTEKQVGAPDIATQVHQKLTESIKKIPKLEELIRKLRKDNEILTEKLKEMEEENNKLNEILESPSSPPETIIFEALEDLSNSYSYDADLGKKVRVLIDVYKNWDGNEIKNKFGLLNKL
jgi:hypothetical protein